MDNLGYQKEPKTEPFWFEVLNLERQQTETHVSNIYIYIRRQQEEDLGLS